MSTDLSQGAQEIRSALDTADNLQGRDFILAYDKKEKKSPLTSEQMRNLVIEFLIEQGVHYDTIRWPVETTTIFVSNEFVDLLNDKFEAQFGNMLNWTLHQIFNYHEDEKNWDRDLNSNTKEHIKSKYGPDKKL